ncbi:MAG: 23S rRNA (adenine(2503)-C(2))-methyltransferase RlmN [Bacteriovoracaceae bacterium]|nr:23S rRNA (adenine(2503)-C(2))-methyltransferase RlmN [Bacteriovoracaceae bacterium]
MEQIKQSLFSFNYSELKARIAVDGKRSFLADQIYDWVYRKFIFDPELWTNVGKDTRSYLAQHFTWELPQIIWNGLSQDGTRKFLLKFADSQTIESVAIPARNRLTLCVSSQVGCAMGCTFCHTATQGLKRHLKVEEVVGQYLAVTKWLKENVSEDSRLSNMVYMGQGEPLHNFNAMKTATEIFLEEKGLHLGQRKITLSTSGLAPQIEKLKDFPPVNIAISLHSPRDEVRSKLMPINKAYNLERLFAAIDSIPLKANRRITYEYLLIDGLNNTQEDLEELFKLIKPSESKINLIPFNEFPGSPFKRPSDQKVLAFQKAFMDRGYTCTIRMTKGEDILAACGQLKSEFEKINLWADESVASVQLTKQLSKLSHKHLEYNVAIQAAEDEDTQDEEDLVDDLVLEMDAATDLNL